ncbi:hypothetical protein BDZ97DRAFT_811192 [Flammula alnicola]|nr:hypothetical protein BDZ97DRAFT_811192 [Flammula alnicola]
MDEKGFQAMTSYSQKSENVADLHVRISSPGPHGRSYSSSQPSRQYTHRDNSVILSSSRTYSPPSSYPQDIYSHESTSSMMDAPPRYPESSQRTLQHRYDHDFDYGYDSSSTYVGDSIHTNPSSNPTHEHHTAQRYPSVATDNTYRSDLQTPLSLNMGSTSMDLQLPPMGSRLPSAPPVVDYRQSVRGYHSIESHTLQHQWHPLQQHPSHDTHDHGHLQGPGFYSSSHLASRRGSAAPKPLQHSHPQTQQQQQHLSPLTYESSVGGGTSYPGSSGGNHNSHSTDARALTHSVGSYPSTHASSSIPMCNSQSRPLYPNIHEEQHQNKLGNDLQHAHSQHQHQIRHTNLDRNANSSAASCTFCGNFLI